MHDLLNQVHSLEAALLAVGIICQEFALQLVQPSTRAALGSSLLEVREGKRLVLQDARGGGQMDELVCRAVVGHNTTRRELSPPLRDFCTSLKAEEADLAVSGEAGQDSSVGCPLSSSEPVLRILLLHEGLEMLALAQSYSPDEFKAVGWVIDLNN